MPTLSPFGSFYFWCNITDYYCLCWPDWCVWWWWLSLLSNWHPISIPTTTTHVIQEKISRVDPLGGYLATPEDAICVWCACAVVCLCSQLYNLATMRSRIQSGAIRIIISLAGANRRRQMPHPMCASSSWRATKSATIAMHIRQGHRRPRLAPPGRPLAC